MVTPRLTDRDHANMGAYFDHLLDAYKEGKVDRLQAREILCGLVAAMDIGNLADVVARFERGRKEFQGG